MSAYQELESLGIPIPPMVPPAAAFIPFVQTGNLLFLSGNIARRDALGQLRAGLTFSIPHSVAKKMNRSRSA